MSSREAYPATGIKVIIVGAGFAGLSLAIECVRNGHEVQIFESAKQFSPLGILLSLHFLIQAT
jgi:2-polyprenyl-6-methoxyphenol hydroxylase-like FAD-dependent oxidoreductase